MGGGGYDSKSGYGIIDAGAAMDYVNTHDVKHGTMTASDAEIEQIQSGVGRTLYNQSAWGVAASGSYIADIDMVTFTIPLVPSTDNELWYNVSGTPGWSYANPNDENRYANVELFNDHATVTTYIYNISTTGGASIGWYPATPENVQLSYSYVGEIPPKPLSVSIGGPSAMNSGDLVGFTSAVSNEKGPVSYQWYYRTTPSQAWISGSTTSNFAHTFYNPGGYEDQAVKLEINSAGETASEVHPITIAPCSRSSSSSMEIQPQIVLPCN